MEIGLHGKPDDLDEWAWRDLGVTWAKWPATIDVDEPPDQRADMERARELGLRVCVDMRISPGELEKLGLTEMFRLQESGKAEAASAAATPAERGDIIRRNQRAAHEGVFEVLAERIRDFVTMHKDFCQDFEWWGEWRCPYTSQGCFHIISYPELLKVCYRTVKDVHPAARVWTGGNGMDLRDDWLIAILQDDGGDYFDVTNWHPYPMDMRDAHAIATKQEEVYTENRTRLRELSHDQPYASTEWGYPVLRRVSKRMRTFLESNIVRGGVSQLYPDEALELYENDLAMMEKHNFEVVIVHMLRDSEGRHWGEKCGLLTHRPTSRSRQWLNRVLPGLEKKCTYELVKRWAAKGRAGRPAFGG